MAHPKLVNLDAMIPRADFAILDAAGGTDTSSLQTISARDFTSEGLIRPLLRKPDFQRETNHWAPEQVVSLLECFVNNDLIPSVILWKSPTYLFVIDGGHRLSAIRSWIEDDYGDGPISRTFFGHRISNEQIKAAQRTRDLIKESIGTWQHVQSLIKNLDELDEKERRRISPIGSRAIPVQWVTGNAEKAEASFFKINTQGTALDAVEELLLKNRRKPIAIGSRAVIRAGMGHKYWSKFPPPVCSEIESTAKTLYGSLFEPEFDTPIKTLDLPLGGSTGVRAALQVLIEVTLAASRNQAGEPKQLSDQADDEDGQATKRVLEKTLTLIGRMTGNDGGSLGLHPAIYFYGPTGRHQIPMFLGTAFLFSRKIANNDKGFFAIFTKVRSRLEEILIDHKEMISAIVQKPISRNRPTRYATFLDALVAALDQNPAKIFTESELVSLAGLAGKILTGSGEDVGREFSDETKSAVFIRTTLKAAIRCPICGGYLDPAKSVSYDHVLEKVKGGSGAEKNCQLTHPYCNTAVKNKASGIEGV